MSDMNPRQDALYGSSGLPLDYGRIDYNYVEKLVEKILKQLPDIPRWIPVTKGLPKRGVNVLAYIDYCEAIEILSLETDGQGMLYWEDANGDYESLNDVKAWMPLPEPYREEEE